MAGLWYTFARWATKTLFFAPRGGIVSIGEENIPATGPVIVAPIHISYLDPPAVACAMRREIHPMAKEELFRGFMGPLLRSLGVFPVRRGESDAEAVRTALAYLERGEVLMIFPEGTRNDGQAMGPMNRGVTMLAKRGNATIVPTGIVGTNIVLPRGGGKGRKHPMTIAFGEPFTYESIATGASEKENREIFARELERRILAQCHRHGLPLRSAGSTEG